MARCWFRVRIWMLMALVAVAAVALGGGRLTRLQTSYRRRVALETQRIQSRRRVLIALELNVKEATSIVEGSTDPAVREDIRIRYGGMFQAEKEDLKATRPILERHLAEARGLLRLHVDLKAKYERAARYPFLPMAADPPEAQVPLQWPR